MNENTPRVKSFLAETLSILGNKFTILAIEFICTVIISRQLTPHGKGIFNSLLIYPYLYVNLVDMGIQKAVTYFIAQKKDKENDIIGAIIFLFCSTSIFGILSCFLAYLVTGNKNFDLYMILLALTLVPLRIGNSYISGIILGKNKIKQYNNFQRTTFLLKFMFIIIFVFFVFKNVYGAVLAHVLAALASFLLILFELSKENKLQIRYIPNLNKRLLSLGFLYSITLFTLTLNYKIDIIILERFSTLSQIGIYTTGVSIAELVWQLPVALETVLFIRTADTENFAYASEKISRLIRVTTLFSLIGAIFIGVISPVIVPIIYGEQYSGSIQVIQLLIPGIAAFNIARVIFADISGRGTPTKALMIFVLSLILNVICNLILVPKYGANGAAIASSISYPFAAIACLFLYARERQVTIASVLNFRINDFSFIASFIRKKLV